MLGAVNTANEGSHPLHQWRSTCSTSRHSVNASPQETQTARPPDRRNRGELRIALINRFNALGTAEIVRVA
jgi:hypothetical protein